MSSSGFIKLHRQILDWGWYRDNNTKMLFLHILLKANFKPGNWLGTTILPGQFVTGRQKLSSETGLTEREIRTSLQRLTQTGEITIKTTNRFSIITVSKWESYQLINNCNDQQTTNKRPANDQQTTTIEEGKNEKKERKPFSESEDLNIPFSEFWDLYSKKVGNKKICEKRWSKLKPDERVSIMTFLPAYLDTILDKQYQPYPEKFLHERRWENEIIQPITIKSTGNTQYETTHYKPL